MPTVGIKNLKNKLSEYIRTAAAGETVLVTDRGRVVAEIVPPREASLASTQEQKLAELARLGIATPARTRLRGPPPRIPTMSLDELMTELEADREDR